MNLVFHISITYCSNLTALVALGIGWVSTQGLALVKRNCVEELVSCESFKSLQHATIRFEFERFIFYSPCRLLMVHLRLVLTSDICNRG